MARKVKAKVSHVQEIDGKEYGPGDSVTLDAGLARKIAARGGIQIDDAQLPQPVVPSKEASK